MRNKYALVLAGLMFYIVTPVYSQSTHHGEMPENKSLLFNKDFAPHHDFNDRSLSFSFNEPSPFSIPSISFGDTLPLPSKNYLRNDDPAYNKRYPLIIPALEVPLTNGIIWAFDRYVINAPYANISGETVQDNFKNGWEWDTDDFITNFSLHPYTGSLYFNAARSNGYNFYQSAPFALGGSLMWELFMENTNPSYNDLINTTFSGIFLGEVLYRLSSSLLDDRKRGASRVTREILGTVIDPERGVNRLWQGKSSRILQQEVYQKEPLSLTAGGGARQVFDGKNFSSGTYSALVSLNFVYGDPYEIRFRKPFDYFRLRSDLGFGNTKAVVNNIIGDAFLFGGNTDSSKKMQMLLGGFQHYDYWNTDSFEIGTLGFGGGVLSKLPVFRKGDFQNQLHLAIVPLGASNAQKIVTPDTINYNYKSYTFSGGGEMKFESALNFGAGQLSVAYYLYLLHTYVGKPGNNLIFILRPRITIKLYRSLKIGYEYLWYYRDDYYPSAATLHVRSAEQRLYLLFDFANF